MVFLLLACAEPLELIDHTAWETEGCTTTALRVEDESIELSTDGCSPARISQILPRKVGPGDQLEIVWWHDFLTADDPATGVFEVRIGDTPAYRVERPIPGPPAAFTEIFEPAERSDRLTITVSNHGANTWDLKRLTRL